MSHLQLIILVLLEPLLKRDVEEDSHHLHEHEHQRSRASDSQPQLNVILRHAETTLRVGVSNAAGIRTISPESRIRMCHVFKY